MSSSGPMTASTFWKNTMPLCTGCDQLTFSSSSWWATKFPAVWKNFFGRMGALSWTSPSFSRSPVSPTCPPRSKYSRVEGTSSSMTVSSSSSRRPTRPSSNVMSFIAVPFQCRCLCRWRWRWRWRRRCGSGADHVEAAVGEQVAAGQVRRLVGGEPEAGAGDELGRGDVPHGRLCDQLLAAAALPVLPVQEALGLHEAGREGVHAHRRREDL